MKHLLMLLCLCLSACGDSPDGLNKQPLLPGDPRLQSEVFLKGNTSAGIGENSPIVFHGQLISIVAQHSGGPQSNTIEFVDVFSRASLGVVNTPDFTLISAIVVNDRLYVFGTTGLINSGGYCLKGNQVKMMSSTDLVTWTEPVTVVQAFENEAILNTSVTVAPGGYVMSFDVSGEGIHMYSQRFAFSHDLINWTRVGSTYSPDVYSSAAIIRYVSGYYYLFKTTLNDGCNGYDVCYATMLARSPDLINWIEQSGPYAVVSPLGNPKYGIGTTDLDLIEHNGKVYFFFGTGTQGEGNDWGNEEMAVFNDGLEAYVSSFF